MKLGTQRGKLRTRLLEAKSVLHKEQRKLFSKNDFDFENKRMWSDDRCAFLQWKVRAFPDHPISYENQQTSVGIVTFYVGGCPDD